ncbi:hypothetical protein F4813DRAFT_389294 [Daldinia decipiens]|uniref:uncharacterized protein n=1 Tax=Daldinia decipiens TaxID=326647 RepID=UPI0020C28F95|nr:uncharacterized protein F4813DRAFT_389294 [Daldinia decipiens]KAI1658032.1 hypothetical protein F4813DRAFT_389294 [Daldinia decipiens]
MSSGKTWTPQEKLEFLLQVIDRMHPTGKGIPFGELNMPGRTIRSLRGAWTNLRAEAAAYRNGNKKNDNDSGQETEAEAEAATATNGSRSKNKTSTKPIESPRRGSRRRTQRRTYSELISDDEEEDKVSVKKARLSSDDEKEEEDSNVDAVTATKNRPVRSTRGAKNGEPKVKLEEPVGDDGVEYEGEA